MLNISVMPSQKATTEVFSLIFFRYSRTDHSCRRSTSRGPRSHTVGSSNSNVFQPMGPNTHTGTISTKVSTESSQDVVPFGASQSTSYHTSSEHNSATSSEYTTISMCCILELNEFSSWF